MEREINWEVLFNDLCEDLEFKLKNVPLVEGQPRIKRTIGIKAIHYPFDGGNVFEIRLDVDKLCTFRETVFYQYGQPKEEAEETAYKRLLSATFCYGVVQANNYLMKDLKLLTNDKRKRTKNR